MFFSNFCVSDADDSVDVEDTDDSVDVDDADVVLAMYHDQGHIPVKLLGFRIDPDTGRWIDMSGVNMTLGLPFVRTSVDHGTAFDIAGKGIASAQSMIEAIGLANRLADHRAGGRTPDRAMGT